MTWYLVYRSLAIVCFIAAIIAGFVSGDAFTDGYRARVLAWSTLIVAGLLAVAGSLLVGLGWNGVR